MKARVKNFDVEVEPMTKYVNESKVIILTEMDINSG